MTKPLRKPRAKPTMHKPKRLCRNQLLICKKAEILRRILYDKVRLQDICEKFDLPASTVCTWKKNSDKILADSVKVGKKRKRMRLSKYKDVELTLLYQYVSIPGLTFLFGAIFKLFLRTVEFYQSNSTG